MHTPTFPTICSDTLNNRPLLNEDQLAITLNISVALARKWRGNGYGPAYLKISRLVRYRPADVEAFIQQMAVNR